MDLVNRIFEMNKKYFGKGVKKMKSMCVLAMIAAMILVGIGPNVMAETNTGGVITGFDRISHVHIDYDPFGAAIGSTTVTTTTITRTDKDGKVSVSKSTQTVTASFHNGSLKTDTVVGSNETRDSDGRLLSSSSYTDTYHYVNGYLDSVTSTGTSNSYTYDKDGKLVGSSSGSLTRTFEVRDGQALLISQVSSGKNFDKDSKEIGTYTSTTTYSGWEYKGGSWVHTIEVTRARSDSNDGSWEETVTTTTYTRDANGTIIGMTQSMTGHRHTVTGKTGAGEVASFDEELINYKANIQFDSQQGWYVASADYDWKVTSEVRNPVPTGGDPVIYGQIVKVTINGVEYIGIKAELIDLLDGNGLQKADGEVWILTGDQADKLKDFVGEQVMVMGDVGKQIDSEHNVLNIRSDYGGGAVTQNVEEALANYKQASWYQANLAIMGKIWADVKAQYGSYSTWRQGVEFLKRLLGLGL